MIYTYKCNQFSSPKVGNSYSSTSGIGVVDNSDTDNRPDLLIVFLVCLNILILSLKMAEL